MVTALVAAALVAQTPIHISENLKPVAVVTWSHNDEWRPIFTQAMNGQTPTGPISLFPDGVPSDPKWQKAVSEFVRKYNAEHSAATLHRHEAEVMDYRDLKGLSFQQIAELLGSTKEDVMRTYYRVRKGQ
jgi:DNA-directed RNA polymerase specialized sigma24 family protein